MSIPIEDRKSPEWAIMREKIKNATDEILKNIWASIRNHSHKTFYAPGIPMDSYADAVDSEMYERRLK